MDKIYVISECWDDYDSSPNPIGYVTTEAEAEDIVAKLREYNTVATGLNTEFWDIRKNIINDVAVTLEKKAIPKWAAGIAATEISKEMRAERDAIIAHNNEVVEESRRVGVRRRELETEAVAKYVGIIADQYDASFMKYLRDRMGNGIYVGSVLRLIYSYDEVPKMSI